MTEADWLTGTDFAAHADFAADQLSSRRQRLLAVAFCRVVDHLLAEHPELTSALAVVELYADGKADPVDLDEARQRCRKIALSSYEAHVRQVDSGASGIVCERQELAWLVAYAAGTQLTLSDVGGRAAEAAVQTWSESGLVIPPPTAESLAATAEQAIVMRAVVWEVAGNPFRPVEFAPWRTDTAVALARQMYAAREFSAMPILADALQDAGCDRDDVLNHCRDPEQRHVRGCWVVDGVLGKE